MVTVVAIAIAVLWLARGDGHAALPRESGSVGAGGSAASTPAPALAESAPSRALAAAPAASENAIAFVDAATREVVTGGVRVTPLLLEEDAAWGTQIPAAAIETGARAPDLTAVDGAFSASSLPTLANGFWVRSEPYVDLVLAREKFTGEIALDRKAVLAITIDWGDVPVPAGGVTVFADPVDRVSGDELPAAFIGQDGRYESRRGVAAVPSDLRSCDLALAAGAYRLFVDDTANEYAAWKCTPVIAFAPGSTTLRCSSGPQLAVTVPDATSGVVWLRSSGSEQALARLVHGRAAIATGSLDDGSYEVGGCGPEWIAVPIAVGVAHGRPEPSDLQLDARRVGTARIVIDPPSRADTCVVARVGDGDGYDYLDAMPDAQGLCAVRDGPALCVVGIGEQPLELIVIDESAEHRSACFVLVQGSGGYIAKFAESRLRTAANAPDFVRRFAERHGEKGASFRVQMNLRLPGDRHRWIVAADRDFLSGPSLDPRTEAAWRIPWDAASEPYRLNGYLYIDGRMQLIQTEPVQWQ